MDIDLTKMDIELKLETFTDHVDSTFTVDAGGTPVELVLFLAEPAKATPKGPGVPDTIREDPFSLLFRGPNEMTLDQRIYSMKHDTLGELALFIVPISQDANGMVYESLIN